MLGAPGSGLWNFGRFRDARLESLMGKVEVEMDPARRRAMIADGHRIVRDQVAFVPLHQQTVTAAMRIGVAVLLPRDGDPTPRFFRFAE